MVKVCNRSSWPPFDQIQTWYRHIQAAMQPLSRTDILTLHRAKCFIHRFDIWSWPNDWPLGVKAPMADFDVPQNHVCQVSLIEIKGHGEKFLHRRLAFQSDTRERGNDSTYCLRHNLRPDRQNLAFHQQNRNRCRMLNKAGRYWRTDEFDILGRCGPRHPGGSRPRQSGFYKTWTVWTSRSNSWK